MAYISGMLQAREGTSKLQRKADATQSRALRNIEGLERHLSALRERYTGLANHRTAEFASLRTDVEGLQHAVRQCEKLATRCVNLGFRPGAIASNHGDEGNV